MPNTAEHYSTKGEALEALADLRERIRGYDEQPTAGSTAAGYFEFAPSEVLEGEHGEPVYFEHAYLDPCDTPTDCELAQAQELEGW